MNVSHEKINRYALIVVAILFLSHAVYLVSQIFFGTRMTLIPPSAVDLLFTGLLSVGSLVLFLMAQKHFRYLLLALLFFWLSFAIKDVAGFLVAEERTLLEISVTVLRMIMCIFLAVGITQGELSRLITRQKVDIRPSK